MLTTSITLEIDPARLADPHVAKAVAAVMLALEGADAKSAPAAPRKGKARKAKAKAKAAPVAAAAPAGSQAAYDAFFAQLPDASQRFLKLLEEKGTLTISDAVSTLGLAKPKSLGGITGAIARWAPVRGATVPFEKLTIEGERAWRWTGV